MCRLRRFGTAEGCRCALSTVDARWREWILLEDLGVEGGPQVGGGINSTAIDRLDRICAAKVGPTPLCSTD